MNLTTKLDYNSLVYQTKFIGRGTFGKVSIKNLENYGNVAIKRIIYLDDEDLKYFDNEYGILKKLSEIDGYDKYIAHFYGYYQEKFVTYFIFEALSLDLFQYQNRLLKNILYAKRYLPIDSVRSIAKQLLEGISFLHKNGIVHCDLKPSNIVFCDNISNNIKIIDFGLSKTRDQIVDYQVQTSNYRAYEVWMNFVFDCPIDMWSFGAILYEMLIGKIMFVGDNEDLVLESIYNRYGNFNQPESEIVKDPWELDFIGHPNNEESAIDLINLCLNCDVNKRIKADEGIVHSFFSK